MPPADIDVSVELVRSLIERGAPQYAGLTITSFANGWDNAVFRLGDALLVRVPRRAVAAELIEHEQRWLPELAPRLSLPIPAPIVAGRPDAEFPWPWSIVAWMPGTMLATAATIDQGSAAEVLTTFFDELHRPVPNDAPTNPYRGIPLADRDRATRTHLAAASAAGLIDADVADACWADALAAAPWSGPRLWLHGDLHPANIIAVDGRIAGVVDFGDLCGGDPATDIAAAWMIFDASHRAALRARWAGADDDLWRRARGWALAHSVACLSNSNEDDVIHHVGARTYRAVVDDWTQ